MKMIKGLLIFLGQLTYFLVISVPLAIMLLLTAHLLFELKRILK
jgi:hypothetical protein